MDTKQLVQSMIQAVVDHPEAVEVTDRSVGGDQVMYSVRVHPDDIRFALGSDGRIAGAARILAKASARRNGHRALLEVECC